jgi:hypothetical protein
LSLHRFGGPFTAVEERSRPVAVSHGTDEGERRRA